MDSSIFLKGLLVLVLVYLLKDRVPYVGNLPGDMYLQIGNLSVFFPLTSGLLISFALSFLK